MSVFDTVRKALLAGVGAQQKVSEYIDELVKKGELSESQGSRLVKEWTAQAEKSTESISKSLSDTMASAFQRLNLPRKDDIDKLSAAITALAERVKRLEEKGQ